ncbi:hypothetical protein COY07_00375 [Candidatus Peregrinibacteria bacterium CG_4_10_14_0_2_um_filter_43_11]|nr:MAG: hypothetical protein COY07_00375 [Candidatus Peregrinibacteria bacterium CG_4_10_14_0_2_um_filter_43_11]
MTKKFLSSPPGSPEKRGFFGWRGAIILVLALGAGILAGRYGCPANDSSQPSTDYPALSTGGIPDPVMSDGSDVDEPEPISEEGADPDVEDKLDVKVELPIKSECTCDCPQPLSAEEIKAQAAAIIKAEREAAAKTIIANYNIQGEEDREKIREAVDQGYREVESCTGQSIRLVNPGSGDGEDEKIYYDTTSVDLESIDCPENQMEQPYEEPGIDWSEMSEEYVNLQEAYEAGDYVAVLDAFDMDRIEDEIEVAGLGNELGGAMAVLSDGLREFKNSKDGWGRRLVACRLVPAIMELITTVSFEKGVEKERVERGIEESDVLSSFFDGGFDILGSVLEKLVGGEIDEECLLLLANQPICSAPEE